VVEEVTPIDSIVQVVPLIIAELASLIIAAIDSALCAHAVRTLHWRETDQIDRRTEFAELHRRCETGQAATDDDHTGGLIGRCHVEKPSCPNGTRSANE